VLSQTSPRVSSLGPVVLGKTFSAPSLEWSPEVARATAPVYEKLKHLVPEAEWPTFAPYIHAINLLKREKNAVILAHNYQTPEIFHGVADVVGDSLQLAKLAAKTDVDIILQCGVHFMAETSKILNPNKTVLIPDMDAGCSLAESITGADVRLLKQKYPGLPVVAYVNTSADVKAEVDICCTSSNAVQVVNSIAKEFGVERVLFVPDQYLAKYVATQTPIEIIAWHGACEVHERFTGTELAAVRLSDPKVIILAHPECPPDVIEAADFTGSTSQMIHYVQSKKPARVVMVTECSMADNVAAELPEVEFVRPCHLCPHMKRITLPKILHSLQTLTFEIIIDPHMIDRARVSVERMVALR
jgi:quinolinate synthase